MFKKYLATLVLIVCGFSLTVPTTTYAQSTSDSQKIRSKIQTLNRGKKVEVKLRDTTKIKGFITAVSQDSFTLESSTGSTETVAYADVVDVKKSGGGLSTKSWLIIGGVAAGVITTWIIVKPAVCDGGAQTRGIC